ncbi:hypothetical protein GT755_36130 [Herbidospora sp. NEAU-GS84]|uniref:Protein phosphatase 2C domain-containing protein n=1 Tax=Herbidospora solisilvae TaxID=2696284 RepID=A0A7C9JK23_9ACTN|nr:hypothetical protein [Herbidospora solisilvae]NAS27083.1 hypothetical protein [Herbidospora solisilvae]
MDVIAATEAGSALVPNEDAVAAGRSVVAVADGVTSLGLPTGCVHGTPWYAASLVRAIVAHAEGDPRLPLDRALAEAIGQVAAAHAGTCDLTAPGTPSATVAVIREYAGRFDHLVLSDATVVVGGTAIRDRRAENLFGELAAAAMRTPMGSAERRERTAEMIEAQRLLRNAPGGYWLAGAAPEAAGHALTGSVPATGTGPAAVMTDGAAALVDLYGQLTWRAALPWLAEAGPEGWLRRVRAVEASDPRGRRWPRHKPGDDATIALCRPSSGK